MFKKKSVYSKYQVLLQLTDTSLNGITFQLFFNLTAIFKKKNRIIRKKPYQFTGEPQEWIISFLINPSDF